MTLQEKIQYHAAISSEIPILLSGLVHNGMKVEALDLLDQWATHAKANSEIWKIAKDLLKEKGAHT